MPPMSDLNVDQLLGAHYPMDFAVEHPMEQVAIALSLYRSETSKTVDPPRA